MSKSESNRGNVELYYKEYYSRMMGHDSDGILSILWKYPHKVMEKPFRSNAGSNILELGFGEGEHIGFVSQGYERYLATDIDADRLNRIKGSLPSSASVLACDALALPAHVPVLVGPCRQSVAHQFQPLNENALRP